MDRANLASQLTPKAFNIGAPTSAYMPEKFGDPDVAEGTVRLVEQTVESEGPTEPWTILDKVAEQGVDKNEARKALRGLKMSNKIVPAGDFTGKIRLVEE